ncbi:NUDIX domain-containing protein [Nocardioides sp. B-3]|uniref:NUDIX domain-containing protein n=1 Tax=Nocardioides sp. B-3 TaxID=2895565 RepID=UPI002152F9F0|nr:NUDIX hydrolase [Nocardioides sp. B-3]UUZ59003.1 NUDIX hydrolase [Nocardioides sp. B-3]
MSRSRDLHRDGWIVALREDVVTRPGHPEDEFTRLSLEHPGAVVVLAVDDDERVLCLRQYRHTTQREFVELPAGLRDAAGEPSVETAKRELREEAELAATSWQLLLSTFASAGISEESHDIFPGPRALGLGPRRLRDGARGGGDGGLLGADVRPARRGAGRARPTGSAGPGGPRLRRPPATWRARRGVTPRWLYCRSAVTRVTMTSRRHGEGRRTQGSQEPRVPRGHHAGRGARAHRARA